MSEEQEPKPKNIFEIKARIEEIKKKLNIINLEKEQWFKKHQEYSSGIKVEIGKIKDIIKERDIFTAAVKEDKARRDELNKSFSEKIKCLKKLDEEQNAILAKIAKEQKGVKIHPSEVRRQISALEKKIETDGISFEKEKELMKIINTLKKEYNICEKTEDYKQKIKEILIEIKTVKKQANELHKKIQENAKESQMKHEEMIQHSRHINEIKKKEKEAYEKFLELKKQFKEHNEQLKTLITESKKLYEEQKRKEQEKQIFREEQKKKVLQEKVKGVEEKLKSGKKVILTMEDLIAFQGLKEK